MTVIKSICIYCGSRPGKNGKFSELAHNTGQILAENNIRMIYGGGSVGLMGIAARSVIDQGGEVVGIIPKHLADEEVSQPGLTDLFVVDNMHQRKRMMFDHSDAFVILPGSIGTLDETLEIITWRQLRLHDKPIVIINKDNYWEPFFQMMKNIVAEEFISSDVHDLYQVIEEPEELLPLLAKLPEPKIDPKNRLF